MASFLMFDRLQKWFGDDGEPLTGGYLRFYNVGTTTEKDVFGEYALSTNNGATIGLDASARLVTECWADAADAYFVELYDAVDVKHGEISRVEVPGGAAQSVPIPDVGEYITGDGTNFILEDLTDRLVPDPSGNANKVLSTDGTDLLWIAKPANGADGVSDTDSDTDTFRVGTWQGEFGTGTGTNAGGRTQTATITFSSTFTAAPTVSVTPTIAAIASSPSSIGVSVTSVSTTSATVTFTLGEIDDTRSQFDFNTAVTFDYAAFGKVAA